jgi:adenosine deaminase
MLPQRILSLPKAELHLHLEGSIQPATVRALAARHGVTVTDYEVRQRYAYENFMEFLESFKWVTSFLRDPADNALITRDLGEQLLSQRVVYAEVTLSVGIMLLRKLRFRSCRSRARIRPELRLEGYRRLRNWRRRT